MTADGVVRGFDFDAAAVLGEMIPVEQHRALARDQAVGNVAGAGRVVVVAFGEDAAKG
ncbi:hypothetical protein D3C87_2157280 [compost metagenome]